MSTEKMTELENELSAAVGRHADWLDGRTFQRVLMRVAEAHFDVDDLMPLVDCEAFTQELAKAMRG